MDLDFFITPLNDDARVYATPVAPAAPLPLKRDALCTWLTGCLNDTFDILKQRRCLLASYLKDMTQQHVEVQVQTVELGGTVHELPRWATLLQCQLLRERDLWTGADILAVLDALPDDAHITDADIAWAVMETKTAISERQRAQAPRILAFVGGPVRLSDNAPLRRNVVEVDTGERSAWSSNALREDHIQILAVGTRDERAREAVLLL